MLDLFDGVRVTRVGAQTLKPGIRDAVKEDDRALDHLRGGSRGAAWPTIPCPAEIRIGAEVPGESQDAIPVISMWLEDQ